MDLGTILTSADAFFTRVAGPLTTVVIALATLLLGFILGRIADRVLARLFIATEFDDLAARVLHRRRNFARATRVTIVRLIYLGTVILALGKVGLLGWAAIGIVGVILLFVLVSLVLSLSITIPSVLGRSEILRRGFRPGDTMEVVVGGVRAKGKVARIGFFDTCLRQPDGEVVLIPNGAFRHERAKRTTS